MNRAFKVRMFSTINTVVGLQGTHAYYYGALLVWSFCLVETWKQTATNTINYYDTTYTIVNTKSHTTNTRY